MCGRPLHKNDSFIGTKGGFPIKFLFLKKYIDRAEVEQIKFALTLLNISRTITPKNGEDIPLDFKSITDPPKKSFKTIPGKFISEFNKEFNLKLVPHTFTIGDFFINLKMGPHGPSILSITETVKWLNSKQLKWIYDLIGEDFFKKYVGPFYSFMKHNDIHTPSGSSEDLPKQLKTFKHLWNRTITGRLSIVKDPECKMRVIAILDYFSQFTLRPIHKSLMRLLSQLPCDRTYTQDPFHNWTGNDPFYSLDLSSATDRFPVHLQQKLLTYLVSNNDGFNAIKSYKWAESWMKLLTEREFQYEDVLLKYKVGQPMGAYSSWAAFTLTHHLVVQFCAFKAGKFPFVNYIILGDDIVIKDNEVAWNYMKFMHKLGVDISKHKTHVSKDTYEFAKRWIKWTPLDGFREITPIPLKGIASNIENPFIVFTILFDYFIVKRNLNLNKSTIVNLVIRLYSNLTFETYKKGKLISKISFSNTFLRAKLNMLNLSIRFSLDLITDCQLREYMTTVFRKHDWYGIPNSSTILRTEVQRVLGISIISAVNSGMSSISKLKRRFTQYWALSFNQPAKLDLFPLFHSINNWAKQVDAFMKDIQDGKVNNLTLFSVYKLINFIDLNEILAWDRNYHSNLVFGGTLWSKAKKGVAESCLETFIYDVHGYDPELLEKVDTMRYNLKQFLDYTKTVEERTIKPLHPKQVEMFKSLSRRHGYAFLE